MIPQPKVNAPQPAVARDNAAPQTQGPTLAAPAFQLTASAASPIQKSAVPSIKKGGGSRVIVAGDTLMDLSKKIYGSIRYFNQIKAANPGKNMVVGDVYAIPEIDIPVGTALRDQKGNDKGLRDVAVAISPADYEVYRHNLSDEENQKDGEFLQLVDIMRSTGMTMDEMGEEQKSFMETKAKADNKSVGEYIAGDVSKRGYGGGSTAQWDALSPAKKADYAKRFKAIVKKIEKEAPDSIKEVIKESKSHGGGFIWEPADVEKNGAFAYTSMDWSLHAGVKFLEAVEADIAAAYPSIAHEMGGHNEYGNSQGFDVFNVALSKMPKAEQDKATAGGNSTYSAYGYMETEIWAELREDEFDSSSNHTDRPFVATAKSAPDVKHQLEAIKSTFAPKIAEALVRSIFKRAKDDDRVTADAYIKFRKDIVAVFSINI